MPKTDPAQQSLFPPTSAAMRRSLPGLKPKRKRGSPGPHHVETAKREYAIDQLKRWRAGLVEIGRETAIRLAQQRSRITSVEVFAELRAQGYDEALDACDPRWMGAVFNEDIWVRDGWEQTGSHKRPVAIWRLHNARNIPKSTRERIFDEVCKAAEKGVTVEEIVVTTGLKGSYVRSQLHQLELLDKVLPAQVHRKSRKTRRRQRVYFIPEHHPEII